MKGIFTSTVLWFIQISSAPHCCLFSTE